VLEAYGRIAGVAHPVYLVRHGQSEWNVLRLAQGQTSHPRLTELGRQQAATAADLIATDLALAGIEAGKLVTSDLVRAVETATVIGNRLGLIPERDARLREQHLGRLEGRSYEESWAADEMVDWSAPDTPIGGGESMRAVGRRMAEVVDGLPSGCGNVVVSHGDSIRAVIAHLGGLSSDVATWPEVPNGAVAGYDGQLTWL